MKLLLNSITILLLVVITSCKNEPKEIDLIKKDEIVQTNYHIPKPWIANRVKKAKIKLNKTDAGIVVWNAMEAHGGLARWFSNGYLSFRFDYQPLDGSTRRNTYQIVDTWNNKARHTAYNDSTASFGWDGKESWVKTKDSAAFDYDTKFWALTPLYLAAYPFILDGEGVNLALLKQKEYEGKLQNVVKVTFEPEVGDAPDDYYVLYFDAESHIVSAIRYIVSYPEYFPNGGHSPEKIMEIVDQKLTNEILLPTGLKTHWLTENEEIGEFITKIDISDVAFMEKVPDNFFSKPKE